ncbi:hypothetical protein H6G25_08855 [Dolichospermum sp. FACHB-1091]|jgi:hypothetical protein|uniref:hypothetical protein n=1 Tax=Dolichospermum sp. FACHB-1091 TaxID=2692798 RepID=UPI00167FF765|nr:hypothetical protein [Dolichospermum sp. FACHB-1091]MBD2443300.1 hypothetical protein [Dolichospermum sp. FACHB-1091]
MKGIVISNLFLPHLESFFYDLKKIESSIVLGGLFWGDYPNWGGTPNVFVMTTYDGLNTISTTYEGAGNFHDNKFHTIDYARTVNAWVYH